MQNPVFIDIGAFKGEEVKWAVEHDYEVHAFEPNINMKKYLESYEDKATIHYAGAWNEDGTSNLHLMRNPEPGEDGLSLMKEKDNVSKVNYVEVPVINIGKYLKKLDKDIDIIKINAEGAEYVIIESILDHFPANRIREWWVEDHERYIYNWYDHKKEVLKKLENNNIKINAWRSVDNLIAKYD